MERREHRAATCAIRTKVEVIPENPLSTKWLNVAEVRERVTVATSLSQRVIFQILA